MMHNVYTLLLQYYILHIHGVRSYAVTFCKCHIATPAVKRAQSGLLAFNVNNEKFFQQQQQQHSYSN